MAKLAIKKASTDVTVYCFIQDSSKTTGEGLAGLAYNTTDLVASYVRPLAARATITLATLAAADSAHSDGGFKEVDATNMPGVYRLDLPDAVCATGVPSVVVMLKGAANMAPVLLEIQLTDFDLNTAAITAAGVADAVWDEATADHTTASSFGALDANVDAILADTGTDGVVLKAAGLNADAVTKIQSGLALEATLTAIKGENWTNETLKAIKDAISALSLGGVDPEVVAGAVLDALMADHQVSGSVAKAIANIKTKTDLISVDKIVITPPAEVVNGTDISILRGDTLEFEVSDLGNLEDATAIDWTVKWWAVDTDSKALVRLRTEAGLLRLNGEEANSDLGAIVVTDPETGIVEVHLEEAATAVLVPGTCVYDLQLIRAGKVRTLVTGKVTVTADVTRAVS